MLYEEMSTDRVRRLHQEAAEARRVQTVTSVRRAERRVRRARARLAVARLRLARAA